VKKSQKSKVKSQKFIFLAIFFPVMLILFSGVSFAAESLPVSSKAEAALVDFSLQDLNGKTVSSADFKGKPVIMFFWATWCPYCRVEIPVLAKKYNEIKGNNIELLAIDIGEKADKVAKFMRQANAEFPVLLDLDSRVANSYNLLGIPTFIFINTQGKIVFQGNDLPEDYIERLKQ